MVTVGGVDLKGKENFAESFASHGAVDCTRGGFVGAAGPAALSVTRVRLPV